MDPATATALQSATGALAALTAAPGTLLLVLMVVFAAALLRGFTGFGFAIAAVPLLGLFMSPARAVPLALGLQFLGGLLDLHKAARHCHWPSLRWLALGAVVGSPIGMLVLSVVPVPTARVLIGAITMVATLAVGFGFALPSLPGRLTTAAAGFVAGLFNGVAAMPGPPAVAFYMASPLDRRTIRSSLLVFFLATSLTALVTAVLLDLLGADTVVLSFLSLPVMWVGTWCGSRAFDRGSERLHRTVSVACLGAIAVISIARGLSEWV